MSGRNMQRIAALVLKQTVSLRLPAGACDRYSAAAV